MKYVLKKFSNLPLQDNNSNLAEYTYVWHIYRAMVKMGVKIAKTVLLRHFSL